MPKNISSVRVLFSSDNQTLEVLESKVSDTGRYQCTAINEAGEDSKLFDVEVQSKSVLTKKGNRKQLNFVMTLFIRVQYFLIFNQN